MLRALGPGSVSSVLKAALDAANVIVWIGLIFFSLVFLSTLIAQPFLYGEAGDALLSQIQVEDAGSAPPEGDGNRITVNNSELTRDQVVALLRGPAIPVGCAFLIAYLGALAAITGRLRRVFVTLTRGDPFHPENTRRLRWIGFCLGALELLNQLAPDVVFVLLPDGVGERDLGLNFNFTAWFSVAVVFVLAEVFREGARLRREAELTI
ncbi:MAG: DUF2975 domain-containing protein [Proteobacteria bacterium]|nr:DUF2975 domain-containing protein [Pseudomonadota bacterium]MBW3617619.1 DUF2975 domain-containing protein [Pseudomonadota bacterium]